MKSFRIIITLFVSSLILVHSLFAGDNSFDSTKSINVKAAISTNCNLSKDSVRVCIVSISDQNNKTIWDRILPLLAALLGAFAFGLVAVYSIRATYRKSLQLETLKQEELRRKEISEYCGTLYALHTIIQNCKRQAEQTKTELEAYRDAVLTKRTFPLSDIGLRLRLDFLTTSTFDYLRHRKYESKLAAYLITYIHASHNFNDYLDFQKLIDTKVHFAAEDIYWRSVKEYFENLFTRLDKLISSLNEMSVMLETELGKFPEFVVLVK